MKILLDTHMLNFKQTGTERYWKKLSSHLKKIPNLTIFKYNETPNNGFYRIFFGFQKAIKKYEPDLIHVQNFTPWKKTILIVNTVHDLCFEICPQTFSLKSIFAFKFFFKRSLKLSDAIICPSNCTKQQLINYYQINPKKIFVIYEAADPVFHFIKNKIKVKKYLTKKFNLTNEYFLVVGNIEKRKLSQEIAETFENFSQNFPNINLVFVGPNKLNFKEKNNIRILGYVNDNDLNYLYNGAIALIYLSLCEGFGLPLVEAMTTKTPIICSKIPVFEEVCDKAVLFVKDKNELLEKMIKIYQDKQLQKKYAQLSFKRSKFFSWKKAAKQTFKIYEMVLKKYKRQE
jgi:glycosyltransferase involved in cell wall biosynthesis